MKITWDASDDRKYETGVSKGVVYPKVGSNYPLGVPWNGLTTVTESPDGAEPTPMWADNRKYLNLLSREDFKATIEAMTYPDEFAACDGSASPTPGVTVKQQPRKPFGFCYRSEIGNATQGGPTLGYKLHLVYGALASPSEKAYATINDTPEGVGFSWDLSTTEENVTGLKESASMDISSLTTPAAAMSALEDILYGTAGADPRLPLPDEVIAICATGAPVVVSAQQPAFNAGTRTITIPTTNGVQYRRMDTGVAVPDASTIVLAVGQKLIIAGFAKSGFRLDPATDDDFGFVGA